MTTYNMRLNCAISLLLFVNYPMASSAEETLPKPAVTAEVKLFEEGSLLLRQGKVEDGVFLLKKSAKQGSAAAAFELASFYELGLGVPKDYRQSKYYYEQAVNRGHRDAHFNLAILLINEQAAFNNPGKARALMQQIAEKGDAEAQYTLATLIKRYSAQRKADGKAAVSWLKKAAEQGHPRAQFSLGLHYLRGTAVTQDAKQAFQWFSKAAVQDISGAQFNLALMYEKGDGVPLNVSNALSWYESAAQLGNANAQQNLGIKYLLGEQVAADGTKALQLITDAAQSGLKNSQFLLGHLYQFGHEGRVNTDLAKAERWYLRAAQQGHANAQYHLALVLLEKDKQHADASFWINQAVAAGHKEAKILQARR